MAGKSRMDMIPPSRLSAATSDGFPFGEYEGTVERI